MTARPPSDRIIAVGLLTQRDVEVLGLGFQRLYPIDDSPAFEELLRQLDRIEAQPCRPQPC